MANFIETGQIHDGKFPHCPRPSAGHYSQWQQYQPNRHVIYVISVIHHFERQHDLITKAATIQQFNGKNFHNFVRELNLLVLKPEYSQQTRSIPFLLMTWLLVSPGHQQIWFWLHKIHMYLSSMRKDLFSLYQLNVEEEKKLPIYFYVS